MATAWEAEYIGLRPKIPMWNECDTALFTALSRMIAGHSGCAAIGAPGCCAFSFSSSVSLNASWTMHTPGHSSISRPNLRLR